MDEPGTVGSVIDLLEESVRRNRDKPAVLSRHGTLRYGQLFERAEIAVGRLRSLGAGRGRTVAVLAAPSVEGILGLVAAVLTGSAYLPLCPSLPIRRIEAMLADSEASVLLHSGHAPPLFTADVPRLVTIPIHVATAPPPAGASSEGMPVKSHPEDPVSVIYTSGSTGDPKGVVVPHRALANRITWGQQTYPLRPGDRVLQHTRYIYDFSAWEVFAALAYGATLVTGEFRNYPDFTELSSLIEDFTVTTAHFVPTLLSAFVNSASFGRCTSLSTIFCGGESLPKSLAEEVRRRTGAVIYNQYGPTETCIDSTFHLYSPEPAGTGVATEGVVPIGRAVARTRLHLLDGNLCPVPDGVLGELHIAGAGLAHGYLGRPGLTADRFIPDPFGDPGTRMYRTGDLVQRDGSGSLVFRGRADLQINLRGVRVELEEVEAVLAACPGIAAAVALPPADEHGGLRAVVLPVTGVVPDPLKVREFARDRLPAAFVPNQISVVARLPRLVTGKIDRAGVRELADQARQPSTAPDRDDESGRTHDLALVTRMWQELLGVSRIGADDDFFELGGHSLLAVELVSRANETLGADIPLADFFEEPTVVNFARLLAAGRSELA
ncbi:non-ribosomal peptide synthetase [Microbispora sp. H10670]|uniref:non-ribosomal peptide synthetase n=1 Tax=Microbispora sp. H10670 TaxID=2729108 RepID=UPI0015FF1334|nr:non-ribosomal peptide synthetase [Microbispora sp. H10670]